jgi:DNA primase small subunit
LKSAAFVKNLFQEYYRDFSLNASFPLIEKREFGFALFEGWMLRHKSFRDAGKLKSFLCDSVPRDAYSSCAYYDDPEAEMERKGWLGADLVFDIDADHIPTSCDKIHDDWTCGKCSFSGKGVTPETCPACGGEKFDANTWPCELCLGSAKTETIKLLDMLTDDFGFSEKDIRLFFSGHRGYHVHVESETIKTLDSIARKEIVDYACGLGFDPTLQGLDWKLNVAGAGKESMLPNVGWRKRIAKCTRNFIANAQQEDYRNLGLTKNVIDIIFKNKSDLLKDQNRLIPLSAIKGVGSKTWEKIIDFCADSQSAKIDTVVTTDIHRLIRLADTLHGKTGFKKTEFPLQAIDSFDPFRSAVAFKKGTASVFVSSAPEFTLGDETFGPYRNQKVELPTAAAVLLVCKRRAEVIE